MGTGAGPRAARWHRVNSVRRLVRRLARRLSRPPGRQPAPPQHQGSREALPRQRLSLRCQALWMRLRASSNFLVEAS